QQGLKPPSLIAFSSARLKSCPDTSCSPETFSIAPTARVQAERAEIRSALGEFALRFRDLHQRRRAGGHGLVEQVERVLVGVEREAAFDHGQEALERAKAFEDGGRLVAAADHAVGALGIA